MIFGGFPGFPKDLSHECEKKKKKKEKEEAAKTYYPNLHLTTLFKESLR